jgi:hypothetical protein
MAEAAVAVGLAASITQFVHLTSKIVERLNEYQKNTGDLPTTFREIQKSLPLVENLLSRTREHTASGNVEADTQSALLPVVDSCQNLVKELDDLLGRILPKAEDSSWRRRVKAIMSIRQERAVQLTMSTLQQQVEILTCHYVAPPTSLQPAPVKPTFMVPFERDPKFVRRASILVELHAKMAEQRRVALVGIGGVGY